MAPRLFQLLLVASAAFAALCSASAADILCAADFPDVGVSYSAAELGATDQTYKDATGQITYYINPCGPVKTLPDSCDTGLNAVAFRVDSKNKCTHIAVAEAPTASLVQATSPAGGMRLVYKGGPVCNDAGAKRSMTIDLVCGRVNGGSATSFVSEDGCDYSITLRHPAACPVQCPFSCSGRGFCGYDTSLRGAHCFCDVGATGDECTGTSSSALRPDYEDPSRRGGFSDLTSGDRLLVALCVILGLLCFCAAGYYLYIYKMRAVKPTIDAVGGSAGEARVLGDDDDPDSIVFSAWKTS